MLALLLVSWVVLMPLAAIGTAALLHRFRPLRPTPPRELRAPMRDREAA